MVRTGVEAMPIDYKDYPPDWKRIRAEILVRADDRCEACGVPNGEEGIRDVDGVFIPSDEAWQIMDHEPDGHKRFPAKNRFFRIVLTVAHLNHDRSDNRPENLKALCQRCHLTYDAQHHAVNARRTRDSRRGQGNLFEGGEG